MATLRELKERIGSVACCEKITGEMNMISSARKNMAEGALRRLLPFRDCVQTIIANLLSSDAAVSSPLTERREPQRVTIVVFGSDDGLCGAYNVNIFKQLTAHLVGLRENYGNEITIEIIPVGKKMLKAVAKIADARTVIVAAPEGVTSKSDGDAVKDFAACLRSRFLDGGTDRVDLLGMTYHTAGRQTCGVVRYLPLDPADLGAGEASGRPYLFEPDAAGIFDTVLPMFLLARMQESFAQNRASEQAARVMAMQSANDNAKKLLEQLQLEYNKLRQQSITTELLDIVGGQVRD